MGSSGKEYWRGFPAPSPGDLPNPGIELASPALAGGFFTAEPPGKPVLAFSHQEQASLVAQRERICLPMQEMWVPSLVREDPLEKEMAIHSSILAWGIPWTEEPGITNSPWGHNKSNTLETT